MRRLAIGSIEPPEYQTKVMSAPGCDHDVIARSEAHYVGDVRVILSILRKPSGISWLLLGDLAC